MPEDRTTAAEPLPDQPKPRLDKAARRQERARVNRLSRLPFLYDYALKGPRQALLANLLGGVLVLVPLLTGVRLVSGEWLPPYLILVVLPASLALQFANRFLNARAGRR